MEGAAGKCRSPYSDIVYSDIVYSDSNPNQASPTITRPLAQPAAIGKPTRPLSDYFFSSTGLTTRPM